MSSTIPLFLTVQLQLSGLNVQLRNPTDHSVRVWEPANSWGGTSWSVSLTAAGSERELLLRPSKQPYTVNLPFFIEVRAHGQREIQLAPSGLEWTFGEDLSAFQAVTVGVRVVLEIDPSKEAEEHEIAIGRLESDEVTSQPPHTWLFRPAAS